MLLIEDKPDTLRRHALAGLHLQVLVRGALVPRWLLAYHHLLYTFCFQNLLPHATLSDVLLSMARARVMPVCLCCWWEPCCLLLLDDHQVLQGVLAPGLATAGKVRQEEPNLLQVLGAQGDAGGGPARSDRNNCWMVGPENMAINKTFFGLLSPCYHLSPSPW